MPVLEVGSFDSGLFMPYSFTTRMSKNIVNVKIPVLDLITFRFKGSEKTMRSINCRTVSGTGTTGPGEAPCGKGGAVWLPDMSIISSSSWPDVRFKTMRTSPLRVST
jgi:hypothetical protein